MEVRRSGLWAPGYGPTVFPRIIAGGDYSRDDAIISNIAHWKSYPKYFVLFSH